MFIISKIIDLNFPICILTITVGQSENKNGFSYFLGVNIHFDSYNCGFDNFLTFIYLFLSIIDILIATIFKFKNKQWFNKFYYTISILTNLKINAALPIIWSFNTYFDNYICQIWHFFDVSHFKNSNTKFIYNFPAFKMFFDNHNDQISKRNPI